MDLYANTEDDGVSARIAEGDLYANTPYNGASVRNAVVDVYAVMVK